MGDAKVIRILGIDPGFGRVGVGIIEKKGSDPVYLHHQLIETDSKKDFSARLEQVHEELKTIINKYKPHCSAVEDLFFYKNVTTAIKVGQARGVILLTLFQAGLDVHEFTPLQVKQSLTGYGRAQKGQIQKMVKIILNMNCKSLQDDAADALAVAITCAQSLRMQQMVGRDYSGSSC